MDPDFKRFTNFLTGLGTTDIPHSGEGFLAHLIGVHNDLARWGCEQDVCRGGLFHSIYGTEKFQQFGLPLEQRDELRELIGARAEELAYWNCAMDRPSFDAAVINGGPRVMGDRYTGDQIELSEQDFGDLFWIQVCDWLEQVPRSQEWDYRREAYREMARSLGGIALEEYDRVFAQEVGG